jgi:hypothetical protein
MAKTLVGTHIREMLFHNMNGCTDGNCVIKGKENRGMITNGGCHCLLNMSRSQLTILSSRINVIADNVVGERNG